MSSARELLELAERCGREEPSRGLDAEIGRAVGVEAKIKNIYRQRVYPRELLRVELVFPPYTTSLDATVTLVPGWYWRVGHGSENAGWAHLNRLHPDHCDRADETTAYAKTPALALCAAALKARAALTGEG